MKEITIKHEIIITVLSGDKTSVCNLITLQKTGDFEIKGKKNKKKKTKDRRKEERKK
jgi:hypothetical protein